MIIPMHISSSNRIVQMMYLLEKLKVIKPKVDTIYLSYMGNNRTYLNLPINVDIRGPNCWKMEL